MTGVSLKHSIGLLLILVGVAWTLENKVLAQSVDAASVIERAQATIGGSDLKSLAVTGAGSGGFFGQAYEPNVVWPNITIPIMMRILDFENLGFREDIDRRRAQARGGSGLPPLDEGDGLTIGFMRDGFAWTTQGAFIGPSPDLVASRTRDLWISSPQGVLLAARRYKAVAEKQTKNGQNFTTLSFAIPKIMQALAWVDANGFVTEVDAKIPNSVLGDMEVVTRFEEYRNVAGLKFPSRIRETQAGDEVFDVEVRDVRLNIPSDTEVPDYVRKAKLSLTVEKVSDGVWFLRGPTHNSIAIEMADHMLLVEAPLSDGYASQVFKIANGLVQGKTVTGVIVSHHHFDHTGGLRYAISQGATVFASAAAKPYYERIFANPNSIAPDSLAVSGKSPVIVNLGTKRVFSDTLRTVETYEIPDSLHSRGLLMVYLPKEKILVEADLFHIRPQVNPERPLPVATELNLVENVEVHGLQVDRILPLHGREASMEELNARSKAPGNIK